MSIKKSKRLQPKNSTLKKEIKNLRGQINELENKNLRLLADFENLKKRKNDEINNLLKFSGENIIKDLIPFFDDLNRILSESDQLKTKDIIDGLRIIINKLYKILENHKIYKFDSINKIFDPDFHDALLTQKSKKKKNTIIEEYEKGYKYNEKVIKHSKVIVSKG